MTPRDDLARVKLPPSIMICECLDGPCEGYIVRVGVRAKFIMALPSL
jgi:hypothetical protein